MINSWLIELRWIAGLESVEICPSLKGFSFTSWDPSDEDLIGHLQSPTKRKLNDYVVPELPEGSDDHAFDIDAVPEAGFANDTEMDTHLGMEDIDEDEGSDRQLNGVSDLNPLSIGAKQLGIVELKDQLSSLPQEYSYFGAAARLAWAGPLHWRFKQGPKRNFPTPFNSFYPKNDEKWTKIGPNWTIVD